MTPAELRAAYEIVLLGTLLYREAQNQPEAAIIAVGCSVRNRVLNPGWWGRDWIGVILHPKQYSSFNPGDPNSTKFAPSADNVFPRCLTIAQAVHDGTQTDTVDGAESYYSGNDVPDWAPTMTHVKDSGAFHFYRTLKAASA